MFCHKTYKLQTKSRMWDPSVNASAIRSCLRYMLRHGYVPSTLRDAILLPIPKGHKDPSDSSNYCGIALASCVSKVLKWYIILTWSRYILRN